MYPQPPNWAGVSLAMVEATTADDRAVPVGGGSVVAPSTLSESRFGPPLAVVAVARMMLSPAVSDAVTFFVCHVAPHPAAAKATSDSAAVPLTVTVKGRFVVVPLASRKVS